MLVYKKNEISFFPDLNFFFQIWNLNGVIEFIKQSKPPPPPSQKKNQQQQQLLYVLP